MGGVRTGVALLAAAGVLIATTPVMSVAAPSSDFTIAVQSDLAIAPVDDQPLERPMSGLAKGLFRAVRLWIRTVISIFWGALGWWGNWFKPAVFFLAVAMGAALADGGLVAAWRAAGFRALVTYSTLMLYVYGCLLFSSGVSLAPKLLFLGALIYGVIRRDLVPDRSWVPGRVEDVVLIVIATRAFIYACPEALVNEYAERAVTLRRRVQSP